MSYSFQAELSEFEICSDATGDWTTDRTSKQQRHSFRRHGVSPSLDSVQRTPRADMTCLLVAAISRSSYGCTSSSSPSKTSLASRQRS